MFTSGRVITHLTVSIVSLWVLTVDARSLLQGTTFFWSGERRITNSSNPYSTTVYAHAQKTVPISEFGGCTAQFCPESKIFSVHRLCFSSQSSTVTISTTLSDRSEHFDSELFVFRVEGDVPPIRGSDNPVGYSPSYSAFWAAPKLKFSVLDDNSGSICSPALAKNNDACKNRSPLSGTCSRDPTGVITECPPATELRKLSRVQFPVYHEYRRPYQCYYAAVGSLDAPPNATELTFGLRIDISPPGPVAAGLSPDNPRQGPFDLRDLGIGALPLGAFAAPFVEPAWLNLTDAVASGCVSLSCRSDPDFAEESSAPMFVYNNLCFSRAVDQNQTAQVRTTYGGSGPSDTTLFVFDDARTISEWNDAGNPICSDGSQPGVENCGRDQVCQSPSEQCPAGADFWQLSRVDVLIAAGVGELCLNAGVGIQLGAGPVVQIGVDVAVVGEGGMPTQAIRITTDTHPNGTTITTTETKLVNGTVSTEVEVVEPVVPAAGEAGQPAANAATSGASAGGATPDTSRSVEAEAGSDGERRATNLGQGLGKWIGRMVSRAR